MLPQTCQCLILQTTFFHYEMSKSIEIFFQCWGFLFANFDRIEIKNLLNYLTMSCGFCIMVLSPLISWGKKFYLVFCFPVISFITCQVRLESILYFRSNHQRCSMEKGALRNFAKFTGKHLCQSLFFNKVVGLQIYLKRHSATGVFL